ncbi:hypothetical protein LSH36_1082g00037 [Paralvinella palmiformis]|uniref:G-protein coupled receptors family 1 profile domain-containing protein n=1 Tax=Paralvinella palmiformis TaxID=53620 RepID=A0AAD9IV83_9ANNE|nr:hypothetical protein LSH36_1082g00037 [Paralvinella palmiformis]
MSISYAQLPPGGSHVRHECSTYNSRARRESMKLARTLFLIFIFFTACWAPYATIVVVDRYDTFRQEVHFFALLLAHTHSSINSVLYFASNQNFRDGYRHLASLLPCRRLFSSSASRKRLRMKIQDFGTKSGEISNGRRNGGDSSVCDDANGK